MKGVHKNMVIQAVEKLKRQIYCLKHSEFMEFAKGNSIKVELSGWNGLDEKNGENVILNVNLQESNKQ